MRIIFFVAAIALFSATSIFAADEDGYFMLKGAGGTACERFSKAVGENDREFVSYAGWVEGYISAINRLEPGVYDLAAWRGTEMLLAALSRYCADHPEQTFHDALVLMARQIRPSAIEQKTAVAVADSDGKSVVLYQETIRRVQANLKQRGLFEGDVSGEWTPQTREALKLFQLQKELPQHGLPDQYTLARLLR